MVVRDGATYNIRVVVDVRDSDSDRRRRDAHRYRRKIIHYVDRGSSGEVSNDQALLLVLVL